MLKKPITVYDVSKSSPRHYALTLDELLKLEHGRYDPPFDAPVMGSDFLTALFEDEDVKEIFILRFKMSNGLHVKRSKKTYGEASFSSDVERLAKVKELTVRLYRRDYDHLSGEDLLAAIASLGIKDDGDEFRKGIVVREFL
jgi:hypothetical protein